MSKFGWLFDELFNAQNKKGTTALSFATQYNQEAIVSCLLDQNADKTLLDSDGKTALDFAKEKGFKNLVAMLH